MHLELECEATTIIIVALVGPSTLDGRSGVAAPLLLLMIGVGVDYLPFVLPVEVWPEIILFLVLPPLLYSARRFSTRARTNERLGRRELNAYRSTRGTRSPMRVTIS